MVSAITTASRRIVVGVLAAVLLATGLTALQPAAPSQALSGSEFNAGNIIKDDLFYDAEAMTEGEIQSFLNAMIGRCTNGLCPNVLSTFIANQPRIVSDRTGNVVCEAFAGGTLTAAQIIYRSQVACGISAKVILVTLQKEQGLITKTAPSQTAVDRAMGMACPDTAPCAAYALGFANQVYLGTKQLKTYKAGRFARQPGVQAVQYHPNAACGSQTVNVQNYATAALYNYTPYTPNAAALANLGGVGNSCSSYGNRNFWVYYSTWFGSTQGVPASSTDTSTHVFARAADGTLYIYRGDGKGSWRGSTAIGSGWSGMKKVFGAGDLDGDGHRDLVAQDAAGALWIYPTDGRNGFLARVSIPGDWAAKTEIFSPGDFNGDGNQDIMSRDAAGDLWLHPGLGRGLLGAAVKVGNGWTGFTDLIGAGDFSGDGSTDIFTRDPGGNLWLYPGNGKGGWLTPSRIGYGWSGMNSISSPGDFDGDGNVDLLARTASGALWLYTGNGRGTWKSGAQIGSGWGGMIDILGPGAKAGRIFADAPGTDVNIDGNRDVLAADAAGNLWLYPGTGAGRVAQQRKQLSSTWARMTLTFNAGDFNGDGRIDVLARDDAGVLWLYAVDGAGGLAPGRQIGNGWNGMTAILGAGDFDGDRKQDILARDAAGVMWLYKGNGAGGFLGSQQVGTGWQTMNQVFPVGDFDGDGNQDLLARDAGGTLWLYPGNGTDGWFTPLQIGVGWSGMTALWSPGDFTGDQIPDVLARDAAGGLWLYSGNGTGTWRSGAKIDGGWQGMASLS